MTQPGPGPPWGATAGAVGEPSRTPDVASGDAAAASVAAGEHQLYDGKTYRLIKALDISPADIEQVYWHTSDPDILFYVDGKDLIRYHVGAGTKAVVTTFDFCSGGASVGSDPLFISWDPNRIGLRSDEQVFIYAGLVARWR
ncbi:hypothetical protein [Sorangium sp. So ce388]|uniref:hypothetical protein n=1 Tax=Sorangium sp. So ce388 TaxID=3133309 RepID=UPI003F5C207F